MATDPAAVATAAIEGCLASLEQLREERHLTAIVAAAELISASLAGGSTVFLFGNGGSASDATHLAAEFVGRFQRDRRALPAFSLCTNESAITAIANDYGFERIFARQLEASGRPGDVAIAISTSGDSANVLAGARAARALGMKTIGLTGADGGGLRDAVDVCLCVPSSVTARVQENHIVVGHLLCEIVEQQLS